MTTSEWDNRDDSLESSESESHASSENGIFSDLSVDPRTEIIDCVLSVLLVILFLSFFRISASDLSIFLLMLCWGALLGIIKLVRYAVMASRQDGK